MALEITVDTKTAEGSLGQINLALEAAVKKIEDIKTAFSDLNLSSVEKAQKSLEKLANTKLENESLIQSLRDQNKALQQQVVLIGALTKATQENTEKKKQSQGVNAQDIANKQALNDLRKQEINAIAKLSAAVKNENNSFTKLIVAKEKLKIVTERAVVTAKLEIGAQKTSQKINLQKLAVDKELLLIQEAKTQAQARLTAITRGTNRQTLQTIALQREQVRLATELAAAIAKKTLSTSKDALELKKLNAELKKLEPSLKRTTKSTNDLSRSMGTGNKRAAEFRAALNALGAGFGIFTGATVFAAAAVFGIVKSLKEGITAFAQFDFAMDRAAAVMEANRVETVQLRTTVRDLAKTTIFTAREVSEGLIFLGQAGQTTSEAMQTLEPTLRLAQIGMIGMQQAADQVTNVMAAFNIQATELSSVVDLLSVVVTSSNTNMSQLAKAISFVGPAAQATNTDLRDTAVILGFFANAGVKASRAGTALRRGLANLANPTEKITKSLIKLGVTTIDPLTGRMKSMIEIIKDLGASGASLTDVFSIFGTRAGPAFAAAILGNSDALDELLKATENVDGATEQLIKRLEDNQVSDFKKAMAAGEEALISFGESIRGVVGPAILGITTVMKALASSIGTIVPVLGLAIKTFGIFFAIRLLPKIGEMIRSFTSFNFAIEANAAAMKAGAVSMTTMQKAGTALSITASRLKFAFSAMLGPIGALIAIGLTVFFVSAKSAAERLAESLQKSVEQLAELQTLIKATKKDSSDLGLDKVTTDLDEMIDVLEEAERALGPTIGERFAKSIEVAEASIVKLKQALKGVGARLSLGGAVASDLNEAEKQAKRGLQKRLDFQEASLAASKAQLEVSIKEGDAQLTVAQALSVQAKTKKTKNDADVAAALKEQGAAGQKELKDTLDAARKELDLALAGGTQTREDLLNANLKILKSEKAILELRISSGVLTEENQAKAVSDLRANLDKRTGLIKGFLSDTEGLSTELKGLIDVKQLGGKFDLNNIKILLGQLNEEVTGTNQSVSETIRKQVSTANKAIQSLMDDTSRAERVITKARLDRAAEADVVELQRIDRFNKLKEAMDKNARDVGIAAAKKEFDLRNISLQEFVDATVLAEQKLGAATLKGLQNKETALAKVRVALLLERDANNQSVETLGRVSTELKTNTKALADNKLAQDAVTQATGAATEEKKVFISQFGKDAQENADKFLRQQDSQLNVLTGLEGQYLSTAEEALAYAINQEKLTDAFIAGVPAALQQVEILEEQRKRMRANSVQIKGLQDEWIESQQNMVGAALDATKQMQTAFEEFLINPTLAGFKDLGKAFLDLIAQILAKRAVLSLFNQGGLGDGFTSFFKGVAGSATGGSFRIGGSGGIDSELFAQKVTPGEIVTISNPNGGDDRRADRASGNQVLNFNNTITISGSGDNKETERMIDLGLRQLESRIARQQQRQQKFLGSR